MAEKHLSDALLEKIARFLVFRQIASIERIGIASGSRP
jgi:hypothetical protein